MKKQIFYFLILLLLNFSAAAQSIITDASWQTSTPIPISLSDELPITNFNNLGINQSAVEYNHPKFPNSIWASTLQIGNLNGIKCYFKKTFTANNKCSATLKLVVDNHCRLYVNNKLYLEGNGYSTDWGTNGATLQKLTFVTVPLVADWSPRYFLIDNLEIGQNTIILEVFDSGYPPPAVNYAGVSASLDIENKPLNVSINGVQNICQGKKTTLTASGGTNYVWSNGVKTASIEVSPDSTKIYSVTSTDASSCKSGVASTTVKVNKNTAKNISIPVQNCSDLLTLSAPDGIDYLWNTGENTKQIKAKEGIYKLSITDFDGCKQTTQITVEPRLKPEVSLSSDLTIYPGEQTQLKAFSNISPSRIIWLPKENLSCENCLSPLIKNYKSAIYKIIIYDIYGCEASDAIKVTVEKNVFAPNVFSPNGDGINDFFALQLGKGIKAVAKLQIFDRWGELVHESSENTWDGIFRAKNCPQDVYTFQAIILYEDGSEDKIKGNINLIR